LVGTIGGDGNAGSLDGQYPATDSIALLELCLIVSEMYLFAIIQTAEFIKMLLVELQHFFLEVLKVQFT
jgi:hypothetical protein